jgi:glycosyltransferase involved in cell wall biosynthesis
MSSGDSIAAIIPCCNNARFIAAAIESALAQTHGPMEIVVVNDGSTDIFCTVIEPYLTRIRIINQVNTGQSAARNRGIDETQSEFIAFLDADDLWLPNKTAEQISFLREHPACGLVYAERFDIDEMGEVLKQQHYKPPDFLPGERDHLADLACRNFIPTSSVVLRRAVLASERFSLELGKCEDWDLWLRLASHTRFGYIKAPLSAYRFHDLNSSRDTRGMWYGVAKVMDRTLRREKDPEVRRRAIRTRRDYLTRLAHLEYEHGNFVSAWRWFVAATRWLEPVDIVRYAVTFLPGFIYSPARAFWRMMRRRA